MNKKIWIGITGILMGMSLSASDLWKKTEFMGWNDALELKTAYFELVVVPSTGKILSFSAPGRKNLLWVNPATAGKSYQEASAGEPMFGWANYGGERVWAVQQADIFQTGARRCWPPDPVLDGKPWAFRLTGSGALRLNSEDSIVSGVRAVRELEPGEDGQILLIRQQLTALNGELRRPLNMIQNVVAVRPPDIVVAKLAEDTHFTFSPLEKSPVPDGVSPQCFPKDQISRFLSISENYVFLELPDPKFTGKFFADIRSGWVAAVYGKYAFLQLFRYDRNGYYGDGGCSLEVYVSNYFEVELLSPARTLRAGEALDSNLVWAIVPLPEDSGDQVKIAQACKATAVRLLQRPGIVTHLNAKNSIQQ